jgi:ribonucleoside-diphosphate reductase protein NrdI
MTIVVDSITGQGKKFAHKLGYPVVEITNLHELPPPPYFLITRSVNFGEIPQSTTHFLTLHAKNTRGVAVSGNRNWGKNYGAAGDKIALLYGIPLVLKFEGVGFSKEIEYVKAWLASILL